MQNAQIVSAGGGSEMLIEQFSVKITLSEIHKREYDMTATRLATFQGFAEETVVWLLHTEAMMIESAIIVSYSNEGPSNLLREMVRNPMDALQFPYWEIEDGRGMEFERAVMNRAVEIWHNRMIENLGG